MDTGAEKIAVFIFIDRFVPCTPERLDRSGSTMRRRFWYPIAIGTEEQCRPVALPHSAVGPPQTNQSDDEQPKR